MQPNNSSRTDSDIKPSNYLLPNGTGLKFFGDNLDARNSIEYPLQFCSAQDAAASRNNPIPVEVIFEDYYPSRALPAWLDEKVVNNRTGPETVSMFYTETGEIAAVLADEGSFVCGRFLNNPQRLQLILGKTSARQSILLPPVAVFVPLLQEIMQADSSLLFHSAGVFFPNGVGAMIVADSGGGKTTTSIAVLRQGARLLADDLIVVKDNSSGLVIHGIPEPINLTTDTKSFFPELGKLQNLPRRDSITDKQVLDPRLAYGEDCFIGKTGLNVIYFVEVSGKGPSVQPIPLQDSLGILIKAATFARKQKLRPESGQLIFDVISRARTYRLQTGPDPVALGKWLCERSSEHAA